MNIKIPKAIIFDLDDTLYSYQRCHNLALKKVQMKLAKELNIPEEKFNNLYDQVNKEIKLQLGKVASSHNKFLYFKKILEKIGFRPYIFTALDMETLYWQTFYDNIVPNLGLLDFFETLRLLNIKSGILTNFVAYFQFKKILHLGVQDYIDHLISSEELGVEKPEPKIFTDMLKAIGADLGEVWMIGNSIEEDILPAKEFMKATTFLILDENVKITNKSKADFVCKNFIFINQKLLKLNS